MDGDPRWDDDLEVYRPTGHLHSVAGMPEDARRMGLDRNVPEGAWLQFAGSLKASKPSHRIVAWLVLLTFLMPLILTLRYQLF